MLGSAACCFWPVVDMAGFEPLAKLWPQRPSGGIPLALKFSLRGAQLSSSIARCSRSAGEAQAIFRPSTLTPCFDLQVCDTGCRWGRIRTKPIG